MPVRKFLAAMVLTLGAALPAAAAELRDFGGEPRGLDEFRGQGKWLVVMIWASDCHVCNQEIGGYVKLHDQGSHPSIQLLGISLDGDERVLDAEAFLERHAVSFPNLIGEPREVMLLYQRLTGAGFRGTPTFMVFAPDGEIEAAQAGGVPTKVVLDFIQSHSRTPPTAAN